MFDQLSHLVAEASTWAYLVIAVFSLLDAVIPLVPSETVVITAGVVAAHGDLWLPLVIVSAAVGAFLGDNGGYWLGRRYGSRAAARLDKGGRGAARLAWAESQLRQRGGELIVVGRFIPGGRTAVTLTSGTTGMAWRRFATYDALAAVLWALYASLPGYVSGRTFQSAPWMGLAFAFGFAFLLTVAIELVRLVLRRRHRTPGAEATPEGRPHVPSGR